MRSAGKMERKTNMKVAVITIRQKRNKSHDTEPEGEENKSSHSFLRLPHFPPRGQILQEEGSVKVRGNWGRGKDRALRMKL